MKVFLLKDVEQVGMAGEILNVSDGYAQNFLLPRKLAVEVTSQNEAGFKHRIKVVEQRKEVVATKTSLLAERIKSLKPVIKAKAHDVDSGTMVAKLYGAISAIEIVQAMAAQGVSISKNQVIFDKPIKTTGTHSVTIKLSNTLQPSCSIKVVATS